MPLRRPIAALAGRTAGSLSRLTRRGGGTAVSGLVTSTLDPNFVPGTLRQLHSTVTVTGTNGKTTTTAALCALARAAGQRVLTNPTGSNLERGLAAALLPHVDLERPGSPRLANFAPSSNSTNGPSPPSLRQSAPASPSSSTCSATSWTATAKSTAPPPPGKRPSTAWIPTQPSSPTPTTPP